MANTKLIKPHYNPDTDEIHAEKNTHAYYHELGHQWLEHKLYYSTIQSIIFHLLLISLFTPLYICFSDNIKYSYIIKLILGLLYFLLIIFDETFAELYAMFHYKKEFNAKSFLEYIKK